MDFAGKHVLIIVENLPVPFDKRVWNEANALKDRGAEVSIICPMMNDYTDKYEEINGINIYRHPLSIEADGVMGYLIEYSQAIFWELYLSIKIYFRHKVDVIHACNPPDLIFLVALPFKLFGVKFVFDHHDASPELFQAKFGKKGLFYRLALFFEWLTFKSADYSIATNESYRQIAIERGGMDVDKVHIVRSGPDVEKLQLMACDPVHKKGKAFLIGYVGVIGAQEGIDLLLNAAAIMKGQRADVHFAIIGGGSELEALKRLSKELAVDDIVTFYGRVSDEVMLSVLNTADVCVNPDVPSRMNDISTMNKIMEYMALKKPIVQFDLKEGRYSAQEASLYARCGDVANFAECISSLLDDQIMRAEMGAFGFDRVVNFLSWKVEAAKLIDFYKLVLR